MIKTYDIAHSPEYDLRENEEGKGEFCKAKDLQKLWDFCDKEQQYLMSTIDTESLLKYNQGAIIAYRKIQYEINGKCSRFEDFDETVERMNSPELEECVISNPLKEI